MKSLIDKYGLKGYQSNCDMLLGKAALAQGLYDEAILYFKDSIKDDVSPDLIPLAEAYLKNSNFEKAIETCNKVLKHNPNSALAHFLLAQVFEKQSKKDLATNEYNKFLQIWKNANVNLPELRIAKAALD